MGKHDKDTPVKVVKGSEKKDFDGAYLATDPKSGEAQGIVTAKKGDTSK
jgi:hypothetical protein